MFIHVHTYSFVFNSILRVYRIVVGKPTHLWNFQPLELIWIFGMLASSKLQILRSIRGELQVISPLKLGCRDIETVF